MELTQQHVSDFRSIVWGYYRAYGRDFPWRRTEDPYAIMVSEFMLQQTQTLCVIPKYREWLERFPAVQDVAQAPLADVLALWNGLGYNRRAKFLHAACRTIVQEHGGTIPHTAEALDALPGIGAYTARAITAFAFNSPEVFIETNIRSVYIHCFFPGTNVPVSDADLLPLIARTLDVENPRVWYYALMDYGAELKRSLKNPSRQSKEYAKQSRFQGSLRQARGAILRQLSRAGVRAVTLEQVATEENIDLPRLRIAAEKLAAERLILLDAAGMYHVAE